MEVVREVIKEVPSEKTLAEMMGNVNFDFDKATITADSQFVLDEIANTPDFVTRDLANVSPLCQSRPRMSSAGVTARSFSKG